MREMPKATQDALAAQKQQSVKDTREKLELALLRLRNGNPGIVKKGTKISASSVAREAEIDRATLYRFHEPVLTAIRKANDVEPKAQLKENRSELAKLNAKLKDYRQLVEEAQQEVTTLARINYRLDARISELEAAIVMRDERISAILKQLNERDLIGNISFIK